MKKGFVIFTTLRYLQSRRKSKGFFLLLLSIGQVAFGVLALTVVIGVMNGFQLSYINNILEISSFHVQIERADHRQIEKPLLDKITHLSGVTSVVPFSEFQVLVNKTGSFAKTTGAVVRAVGKEELASDTGFYKSIFSEDDFNLPAMEKKFDIDEPNSIVIGNLLEYVLGVRPGSELYLTTVNDFSLKRTRAAEDDEGVTNRFFVTEIFKSGYSEIDLNYLFMSLQSARELFSSGDRTAVLPITYGVKLTNRYDDLVIKKQIESLLNDDSCTVKTWRDFNQGFFAALLMEKLAIMFLVGLIFIVVGFSIFNSLRQIVYEKYEEIGVLKALGASPGEIKAIFIFEGFLLGLIGGIIGLLLGLIMSSHINETFEIFTGICNFIIGGIESAISNFNPGIVLPRVSSPFSPDVFYLREVPSKVILGEAVLIFFFAVFSTSVAAFLASRKITAVKPAEVLRYE